MKLRRIIKAQNPKKKKKERNNNNNKEKRRGSWSEDMQQGSRSDQRTCSKDLGQAKDMQQEESTSRPYVCSDVCKKPLKI